MSAMDMKEAAPARPYDTGLDAASFDSLRALLRRARLVLVLMLAATAGLLLWHHFGMTRTVELNAAAVPVKVEDDRGGGGGSVGTVARAGRDLRFGCTISARGQWPYCKLLFELAPPGQGIDLSRFDSIVVQAGMAGRKSLTLGFVVVNDEEDFTRQDRWETFKINQIDGLDIDSGVPYLVPLRWFAVPQWWKDMARPPVQHSFVNMDRATRLEILTSGGPAGERVIVVRSVRLVGKLVSRSALLAAIAAAWIAFAIGWLGVANTALRSRLRATSRKVTLLAQVNKALELEAKELAGQAHTDPLTGVLNRQGLRAELMSTSTLLAAPMSVIFADIDHFKKINDRHGHDAGDEVLRRFAGLVASHIRSSDRLVRWGGEEFLIVCPLTDARQAARLAGSLRAVLHAQPWPLELRVTASFGIAQHRDDSEINRVIKEADEQLYRAKAQGRDQVCVAEA
jgi:diguanylate cyclase (GGDEF)-like protein